MLSSVGGKWEVKESALPQPTLHSALNCSICLDMLVFTTTCACGHSFWYVLLLLIHQSTLVYPSSQLSISFWLRKSPACPSCRAVQPHPPGPNRVADTILETIATEAWLARKAEAAPRRELTIMEIKQCFDDRVRFTVDEGDGVSRCGNCNWVCRVFNLRFRRLSGTSARIAEPGSMESQIMRKVIRHSAVMRKAKIHSTISLSALLGI
jgi:hypothetical protein